VNAPKRPLRVFVGLGVVGLKFIELSALGFREFAPGESASYHLGALFADILEIGVAVWLIYSGWKPAKARIPKNASPK
jgi:hypothetical protein